MKWILKDYLNKHDLTPYQLAKETGLSSNTIYPLARGEALRVSLETLQTVLEALDNLTGRRVSLSDVLDREDAGYEFSDDEPVPADIREGIRRLEAGETTLRPWSEVAAEQRAKRNL